MSDVLHQLNHVLSEIEACAAGRKPPSLIAVSKTFDTAQIEPVLVAGHRQFGENRVQESQKKWPSLREKYPDVILHLIGPLQSNKVADAVALFDVIHTVDRPKIAKALASEMIRQDRSLDVFVQINTGGEAQKAGVRVEDADVFIENCRSQYGLRVVGLMCIPPIEGVAADHFKLLSEIAKRHDLADLSMGMSSDYRQAIDAGATFVRLGSAVFGSRDKNLPIS